MPQIRPATEKDWPAIWSILEPVFAAGETYAVSPDIDENEARALWLDRPVATYIAGLDEEIVGTYYIKANQAGPGAHVCNCGYVTSDKARGRGVARAMCLHSQKEARRHGFKAMQFNLVVATNLAALTLWLKLGFRQVGRLEKAFQHPSQGLVDGIIMYKWLAAEP
ncbi:MAG: GNAT family N-acetyltransferase [Geminicoccaceae bacterium]